MSFNDSNLKMYVNFRLQLYMFLLICRHVEMLLDMYNHYNW